MNQFFVKLARKLTGQFLFRKSLPSDFLNAKILACSRADIQLLAPGFERSSSDLFAVVRKYVSSRDVVWDIGSNLGILTFCSAIKVGKEGFVYSLEADPRYADIQTRTLKNFNPNSGKISILCAAAADHQGILELTIPKKGHARNHLSVVEGNSAGEADMIKQVVTVTLDWLLNHWKKPDFVKIDVEGAELLAILGADRLFSEIRPVAYIECSPENRKSLTDFFKARDYELFSIDKHGNETQIEMFEFNTVVKPKSNA